MKELVEQVIETQKNVKVAQTELRKSRRRIGRGWGGAVPSQELPPSPGPASCSPSPSAPRSAPSSGGDGGEPGAAAAQRGGGQGGAEAALRPCLPAASPGVSAHAQGQAGGPDPGEAAALGPTPVQRPPGAGVGEAASHFPGPGVLRKVHPRFPPRPKAVWTPAGVHPATHAQLPPARCGGGPSPGRPLAPGGPAGSFTDLRIEGAPPGLTRPMWQVRWRDGMGAGRAGG